MDGTIPHLDATLARFALPGAILGWERYGNGHINDTLRVRCAAGDAIVQRLNGKVFPDGAAVMGNIARVLDHLATVEPDAGRRLALIPGRDGERWLRDPDGTYWRAYPFITGARTVERVSEPGQARVAADAFARFLAQLDTLPGSPLATVIAGFHDTPARLRRLAAVAQADACGRRAEVADDLAWALAQDGLAGTLERARGTGLHDIATHNDTKINNLLLEPDGAAARCVIDLDTLMPGLPLYDFGDLVRTASCRAAEDGDPAEMRADPALLAALVDGWLAGRGAALQPAERELMPLAGAVITFECGIRFLTDHLEGDRYFRIRRPGHNRDRARAQLALTRDLVARSGEVSVMIQKRTSSCQKMNPCRTAAASAPAAVG